MPAMPLTLNNMQISENRHFNNHLSRSQLEILHVLLNNEKILLHDKTQRQTACRAIEYILKVNGYEGIPATSVYSQLMALYEHDASTPAPAILSISSTIISERSAQSDTQETTKTKSYPLHDAAREGDLAQVQKLINLGYQVNFKDPIFGSTPIHMAAMYGHAEVVAYLIQAGADLTARTYVESYWFIDSAFTALDLALRYEAGTNTLTLLLENGATYGSDFAVSFYWLIDKMFNIINLRNYAEFSLCLSKLETLVQYNPETLYIIENDSTTNSSTLVPLFVALNGICSVLSEPLFYNRMTITLQQLEAADTEHIAQHYMLAKNLTHAFPSDNIYHFQVGNQQGNINAEGHSLVLTTNLATRLLKNYHALLQETNDYKGYQYIQKYYHYFQGYNQYQYIKMQVFDNVSQIYAIAAEIITSRGLFATSEYLYELYCHGQTLILPTGWDGHAIDIILNKELNLFMVANAGEQYSKLTPGLNAYHHKYAITVDDIYQILTNYEKIDLEFKKFYDLGLTLNDKYSFETEPQWYGNCGWYSHQIAEKALLYIELSRATGKNTLSLELADIWFEQLDNFQQTSILQEYLAHPSLEIGAIADILVNYHNLLKTPAEIERANLMLDYLTISENKPAFEQYYLEHHGDFSHQLKEFIKSYEINMLFDDLYLIQDKPGETVGSETIHLHDVISMNDSHDLLSSLNHPVIDHQVASTLSSTMPPHELDYSPASLAITPLYHEQEQVVVVLA